MWAWSEWDSQFWRTACDRSLSYYNWPSYFIAWQVPAVNVVQAKQRGDAHQNTEHWRLLWSVRWREVCDVSRACSALHGAGSKWPASAAREERRRYWTALSALFCRSYHWKVTVVADVVCSLMQGSLCFVEVVYFLQFFKAWKILKKIRGLCQFLDFDCVLFITCVLYITVLSTLTLACES